MVATCYTYSGSGQVPGFFKVPLLSVGNASPNVSICQAVSPNDHYRGNNDHITRYINYIHSLYKDTFPLSIL